MYAKIIDIISNQALDKRLMHLYILTSRRSVLYVTRAFAFKYFVAKATIILCEEFIYE